MTLSYAEFICEIICPEPCVTDDVAEVKVMALPKNLVSSVLNTFAFGIHRGEYCVSGD